MQRICVLNRFIYWMYVLMECKTFYLQNKIVDGNLYKGKHLLFMVPLNWITIQCLHPTVIIDVFVCLQQEGFGIEEYFKI